MKVISIILCVIACLSCTRTKDLVLDADLKQTELAHSEFDHFITRDGKYLMDGMDTMRFISWNIPNLNYVEDEMKFDSSDPFRLPTEYEIRDALNTIKEMGGQVVRLYTIPVRSTNHPPGSVTYVEAPGVFNEKAFQNLDLVLALANEIGIRVIIPFVNNWQWMGGAPNYAAFRNKEYKDFFSDTQLWADLLMTVDHVLDRKNTITGTRYIDDKAIMCWESGNELQNPPAWASRFAAHVKSKDTNHLFMDGYHAVNELPIPSASISDDNIDIVTSHHYEKDPVEMLKNIKTKVASVEGKKPYFVGEFGFVSTAGMEMILSEIVSNENICGGMSWSIRTHHKDGGFFWHSEPSGLGLYKAFHWPGFHSGSAYDEKELLRIFRNQAFYIQNINPPQVSVPTAPILLENIDNTHLLWRGSTGAQHYEVQRMRKGDSKWEVLRNDFMIDERPYFSDFQDNEVQLGSYYKYRVRAINESGKSKWSEESDLFEVVSKKLVDHPSNFSKCILADNISIDRGKDRSYKELLSRAVGTKGSSMTYKVDGNITAFKVFSFSETKSKNLQFSISEDGEKYKNIEINFDEYSVADKLYKYQIPAIYSSVSLEQASFLKIDFLDKVAIGRIEIDYK